MNFQRTESTPLILSSTKSHKILLLLLFFYEIEEWVLELDENEADWLKYCPCPQSLNGQKIPLLGMVKLSPIFHVKYNRPRRKFVLHNN